MGDARKDDALEVREDRVVRFAALGRRIRELIANLARAHAREHGKALGMFEVVRDPVGEPVRRLPERVDLVIR
jgi:hypothetical protein